jgi:holo-[acyl-carrier protein] synthase
MPTGAVGSLLKGYSEKNAFMSETPAFALLPMRMNTGIDLVQISRMRESLEHFGEQFCRRIFTQAEQGDCIRLPAKRVQRLAARYAAKEAALKALQLADAGVAWTDIEVVSQPDGSCRLALHGRAEALAAERGPYRTFLSLTEAGDYASAVVVYSLLPAAR